MQEFNYIDYGYSLTGQENDSVKNSTESGYAENLNTEYTYVKGIGCKINSYFISDNAVGIQLDFDFSNKDLTTVNVSLSGDKEGETVPFMDIEIPEKETKDRHNMRKK